MFRVLVLQTLYTLSDELRDRLSFMRFIGLSLHEPVPDAKTIWLYREQHGLPFIGSKVLIYHVARRISVAEPFAPP